MSSKRCGWMIYNEQMFQLRHGDALWEPAPIHSFKRVQLGDVGYVRRGRFHLLFSAGRPLGERQLGVDVPLTFEPLNVGPTIYSQPRLPGYLSTDTVREIGADLGVSMCSVPVLEPGVSISFELTEKHGAALVTKYRTYREDVELESTFKTYTKRHYDSWVTFAYNVGHGDDIKPVLVTGVDMTRDFAMIAYSNDSVRLTSKFTISAPMVGSTCASAWGTWRTEGLVHTNCGPQLCSTPSSTQTIALAPSGNGDTEAVPDEYNQCVFVRYYTMRKRALVFPTVIKAAAGPHDLGSGGRDDEELLGVEVQFDSHSDLDTTTSLLDEDGGNDRSSASSLGSESDIIVYNATADERDVFDDIGDYVFRNSDAESVLIHHRDIPRLREPGGGVSVSTQLSEKGLFITVDGDGVGAIGCQVDPERGIPQSTSVSDEHMPTFPVSCSEIFDEQGSTDPTARMTLSHEVREAEGCVERHTEESENFVFQAANPLSLSPLATLPSEFRSPIHTPPDRSFHFGQPVYFNASTDWSDFLQPAFADRNIPRIDHDAPNHLSDHWSPSLTRNSSLSSSPAMSINTPSSSAGHSPGRLIGAETHSSSTDPATSINNSQLTLLELGRAHPALGPRLLFTLPTRNKPQIGYNPGPPLITYDTSSSISSMTSTNIPSSSTNPTMSANNAQLTVWDLAQAYPTSGGVPIPQKVYRPHTQDDRRRYVEVELGPPIMFYLQGPAECGIPLRDALIGKYTRLVGPDDEMFRECGPSVSLRLKWPGYGNWSRQIPTKDFRNPPSPITRSKLAKNVARSMERFIKEKSRTAMDPDEDSRWKVGMGHITIDDLVLVGLQHVSKGSWQCHLRLNRPL